ncbi:hypothetical protein Taro_006992, partial [Colocasia esculenta]|nr:hypothetical protein [Colocasia esculenta]
KHVSRFPSESTVALSPCHLSICDAVVLGTRKALCDGRPRSSSEICRRLVGDPSPSSNGHPHPPRSLSLSLSLSLCLARSLPVGRGRHRHRGGSTPAGRGELLARQGNSYTEEFDH